MLNYNFSEALKINHTVDQLISQIHHDQGLEFDVDQVLAYYSKGFFLLSNQPQSPEQMYWCGKRVHTLLPLDDRFHCPKSLRRFLNQGRFQFTINQAFVEVVQGCASHPNSWISDDLQSLYFRLYRSGVAYSFESWLGDDLAGGILGIVIGGVFIGESMFYRSSNGSKVALVQLVKHLQSSGFLLFNVKFDSAHLLRFGTYQISESLYQKQLEIAIHKKIVCCY